MNSIRSIQSSVTSRALLVAALLLGAHAASSANIGLASSATDLMDRAAMATHQRVCSFDHPDKSHLTRHATLLAETAAQHLYRKGQALRATDKPAAFEYLVASSKCWHLEGAYAAATMAISGEGSAADRETALALLVRAADLGHVEAAYEAAVILLKRGNTADGEMYLQQAAEGGHPVATRMFDLLVKVNGLMR